MLAKKIKMENIKKQREFIEAQLKKLSLSNDDGDTSYPYVGYIFPEIKRHFISEGFKIVEFNSDSIVALTKGRPIHLFTIKDDIVLSDEELREAEDFETLDEKLTRTIEESGVENPFNQFLERILGISLPSEEYEHDNLDDDDGYEDEEP